MVKLKFVGNFWSDAEYLAKRVESNWGDPQKYNIELVTDDSYDYLIIINGCEAMKHSPREKNISLTMEPDWSPNADRSLPQHCFLTITSNKHIQGEGVDHRPIFMFYEDSIDVGITCDRFKYDFNFDKPKKLSVIFSNWNNQDPNHNYYWRETFIKRVLDSDLDIDIYGKNWNISDPRYKGFVKDKIEALKDYEYSIAIENSCEDYYVSEKLFDCFLNNTVPIYYGCQKIKEIYDERSYILFDPKDPDVINTLKNIVKIDNKQYKDYILESKARYFTDYNFLHYINENFNEK